MTQMSFQPLLTLRQHHTFDLETRALRCVHIGCRVGQLHNKMTVGSYGKNPLLYILNTLFYTPLDRHTDISLTALHSLPRTYG